MKNARDVALTVLRRVDEEHAFAAAALARELTVLRDPRESALAYELVHGVLRRRSWLDYLLFSVSVKGLKKIDPDVMRILRIAAYQIVFLSKIPHAAAVSDAVRMVKHSRARTLQGLTNALLRKLAALPAAKRDPAIQNRVPPAVAHGLPDWIFSRLEARFGPDGAAGIAERFNRPSRRTLRVNRHRDAVTDIEADPAFIRPSMPLSPFALDVVDMTPARRLLEEGLAAFQDEAAQLAVIALDPQSGDRILDACAGRGGKTAAIAMITENAAKITAVDRAENKLERLAFELARQRLAATTVVQDLAEGAGALTDQRFDKILLDAPCSGSGTLGRRPEIRWRLKPSDIAALSDIQTRLLDAVAPLAAPGGRLLFVTCSLFPEEGAAHAERFLARHPDFTLLETPPSRWPDTVPWHGGNFLVNPADTDTDGYQMLAFSKSR